MKIIISLCIALFTLTNTINAQHFKQQFVYTHKEKIKAPNGDVLQLKGVNLGNWLLPEGYMFKLERCNSSVKIDQAIRELIGNTATTSFWDEYLNQYVTKKDIQWLAERGVNLIRLPFDYRLLTHDDFLGRDYHGYKYIDQLIKWCAKYNIYVLLDMHAAPGGQTGDNIDNSDGYPWLFIDQGMQKKTCLIWKEIAKRYADNKTVIGYNLLNEPIAHYFKGENLSKQLEPLYKKITKSIRKVDKNHIVFIGGASWENDFSIFSKPFDSQLVYTFHKYWMKPIQKEIQEYLDFRNKYAVPVLMGESGENTDEWVEQFRVLLDKHKIHWTFWPYKKMDSNKCPINFKTPVGYDNFVEYAESDRGTYKQIRGLKDSIKGISRSEIQLILKRFVENAKFKNCFANKGYCKALDFK